MNSTDTVEHSQGLLLALVVLQTERLTGLDEQDLADVPVGLGEDLLVAPRFVDESWPS